MDQLKIGEGIHEVYDMLKDASVVGSITIESKYFNTPKIYIPDEAQEKDKMRGFSIAQTNNFNPAM